MSKFRTALLGLASTVVLATAWGTAQQTRPSLADYFTVLPQRVIDAGYSPTSIALGDVTEDLNGDGLQDMVILGHAGSSGGATTYSPQQGRVFLGDGNGGFTPAPAALFPVDTLLTVHSRKVLFADFNADERPDMFISSHGWDAPPFPGEQNRLYLSRPEGGWRDATDTLPQISDFSHTSAAGDISGRGLIDIFVGNGYASSSLLGPYTLLNNGSGQFTRTTTNIPVSANQALALNRRHFPGATFADLNDDGLPELIGTADRSSPSNEFRQTIILWNRAGVFVDTDKTELPEPAPFSTHQDLDVQRIDVNQDGLPDLVLAGTQGLSGTATYYDGWFVRVLINRGDRQFVDETAERVPQGNAFGGTPDVPTQTAAARWVRVLDFNQDRAPDFSVEYLADGKYPLKRNQSLVWLNDGTGRFSTLKVSDFVRGQ
jgi:VCBS repeat protein